MKKTILFFMIMLAARLFATDYYIDGTNGNDANSGASLLLAFKTLQKAADTAISGDNIILQAGIYIDTLLIKTTGTVLSPIRWYALQAGVIIRQTMTTWGQVDIRAGYHEFYDIEYQSYQPTLAPVGVSIRVGLGPPTIWYDGIKFIGCRFGTINANNHVAITTSGMKSGGFYYCIFYTLGGTAKYGSLFYVQGAYTSFDMINCTAYNKYGISALDSYKVMNNCYNNLFLDFSCAQTGGGNSLTNLAVYHDYNIYYGFISGSPTGMNANERYSSFTLDSKYRIANGSIAYRSGKYGYDIGAIPLSGIEIGR